MLFPLLHCKRDLPQSPAVCLLGLNGTFARLSAMSASGRERSGGNDCLPARSRCRKGRQAGRLIVRPRGV
jgi:hypothetical protein